ncbi:MAG: ferredoxin, partial [Gammaproteobacteria bacterium]|nr:ferredoxin [Gammaproteobacteria bacterium]
TWNDHMVVLHEFLKMDEDEREGQFHYIWGVDGKNHLTRILLSNEMVLSCEERRDYWHQLRSLCGEDKSKDVDVKAIADQAKAEMVQTLTANLMAMSGGNASAIPAMDVSALTAPAGSTAPSAAAPAAADDDYEPVWIETPECTACDECTDLAPDIFKYNDENLAIVVNPQGGSFEDIVKSAEKCTAEIIHPGTPWNKDAANLEKLIKRAEKFQ